MTEAAQIVLIAALSRERVIGLQGGLPWRLPGDLAHFRRMTMGKPVILGRKTFDELGGALPGREMIVLSRNEIETSEGVRGARSMQEAINLGRQRAQVLGVGDVCVIGGGEVFRASMAFAKAMVLTWVEGNFEGDTWFPEFSADDWCEVSSTQPVRREKDETDYSFSLLQRRKVMKYTKKKQRTIPISIATRLAGKILSKRMDKSKIKA